MCRNRQMTVWSAEVGICGWVLRRETLREHCWMVCGSISNGTLIEFLAFGGSIR